MSNYIYQLKYRNFSCKKRGDGNFSKEWSFFCNEPSGDRVTFSVNNWDSLKLYVMTSFLDSLGHIGEMEFKLIVVFYFRTLKMLGVFAINDSLDFFEELLIDIVFLLFFCQFLPGLKELLVYLGLLDSIREIMISNILFALTFVRNRCDYFGRLPLSQVAGRSVDY